MTTRRTIVACLAGLLAGCASQPRTAPTTAAAPPAGSAIVIDGDVREWPEDVALIADGDWLSFRVSTGRNDRAIQASDESLVLDFDTDADPSTGKQIEDASIGADLEVCFSPIGDDGKIGSGVAVYSYADGVRTDGTASDIDFCFAPTPASEWYEGRLSRRPHAGLGLAPLTGRGVRAVFTVYAPPDELIGRTDVLEAVYPPLGDDDGLCSAELPAKPEGAVRVVSWNVLRSSPMDQTGPFANILTALDPDIVLFQEWDEPADTIESWLLALVPSETGWHVRKGDAWGVAVASKYPLTPLGPDSIVLGGAEHPVRLVAAEVDTPLGLVAAGSIHLKCCGGAGSVEDQTRLAEAALINDTLEDALSDSGANVRVFAGDFNLVGTFPPLDVMRDQLDLGGASLRVARTLVLGDNAIYTWREDGNAFAPGRLDYLVYGDAGADLLNAFVLDTRRLDDTSLARMGLYRADSEASDHMPLVVDLRPTR